MTPIRSARSGRLWIQHNDINISEWVSDQGRYRAARAAKKDNGDGDDYFDTLRLGLPMILVISDKKLPWDWGSPWNPCDWSALNYRSLEQTPGPRVHLSWRGEEMSQFWFFRRSSVFFRVVFGNRIFSSSPLAVTLTSPQRFHQRSSPGWKYNYSYSTPIKSPQSRLNSPWLSSLWLQWSPGLDRLQNTQCCPWPRPRLVPGPSDPENDLYSCCYWWWCWWLMMIILTLWSGTQVKDRCCQLWHELQESWNKKNLVPWKFLGVHRQKAHKAKPDKDHIRKQNKQKKKLVLLSLMKSRCSPIVDWDKNNPFINQKAGLLIIGPLT